MFSRFAVVATVLLTAVTGCSARHSEPPSESWTTFRCDQWGGQPPEPCRASGTVEHHEVSYRLSGSASGAIAISLFVPVDTVTQGDSIDQLDHSLPWSTTFDLDWSIAPHFSLVGTAAHSSRMGTLKCEILIDAEVVATNVATDGNREVICATPAG